MASRSLKKGSVGMIRIFIIISVFFFPLLAMLKTIRLRLAHIQQQ